MSIRDQLHVNHSSTRGTAIVVFLVYCEHDYSIITMVTVTIMTMRGWRTVYYHDGDDGNDVDDKNDGGDGYDDVGGNGDGDYGELDDGDDDSDSGGGGGTEKLDARTTVGTRTAWALCDNPCDFNDAFFADKIHSCSLMRFKF